MENEAHRLAERFGLDESRLRLVLEKALQDRVLNPLTGRRPAGILEVSGLAEGCIQDALEHVQRDVILPALEDTPLMELVGFRFAATARNPLPTLEERAHIIDSLICAVRRNAVTIEDDLAAGRSASGGHSCIVIPGFPYGGDPYCDGIASEWSTIVCAGWIGADEEERPGEAQPLTVVRRPEDLMWEEAIREFRLKLKVLGIISESLRSRDPGMLVERGLQHVKGILGPDCLRRHSEDALHLAAVGGAARTTRFWQACTYSPTGIADLLMYMVWCACEIEVGQVHSFREALGDDLVNVDANGVASVGVGSYFSLWATPALRQRFEDAVRLCDRLETRRRECTTRRLERIGRGLRRPPHAAGDTRPSWMKKVMPINTPPGTRWGDITIQFRAEEVVVVTAPNLQPEERSFITMGCVDPRTRPSRSNKVWGLLQLLAREKRIQYGDRDADRRANVAPHERPLLKKCISELRKRLRAVFPGVAATDPDPFLPYRRVRAYELRCQVEWFG